MGKTLIIVESPSKAKTLTKYLGSDYIVLASYGHVMDLNPESQRGLGVDVENDFHADYVIMGDKKDKVRAIVHAASGVDAIFLATDPDREGEAISWHLADILSKFDKPIKRVMFKSFDKKPVLEAIKNPVDLDSDLFFAQQARRVVDRLVGYLVSPYLIKTLGKGNSAGRVQSVAVKLVVDRDREIDSFVPDEYWSIMSLLETNDGSKLLSKYSNKVTTEAEAMSIKSDLMKDSFVISNIDNKEKSKPPPLPLITSSLAICSVSKYKYSTDKTMKIAQKLYESGLITYMRTDSLRISDDALDSCREWIKGHGYDIPNKPNIYSKKGAQDAHEAIRPTDVNNTPDLLYVSEPEKNVYKLIWERFVASQMNSAIYSTASVTIKSSSGHILKSNGRILKYKGWLDVTNDLESDKEDKDEHLPDLYIGDELKLTKPGVTANQKFTQPPTRFSEKTLIRELEKKGIGRPSTFASIMSKITSRNYIERKSDFFYSTEAGRKATDNLSKFFHFMDPQYTSELESKLDIVADGKLEYVKMLSEFYAPFQKELQEAYKNNVKDYGISCNICKSRMDLRNGQFGYYMFCTGTECNYKYSVDIVDDKPVAKADKNLVKGIKCSFCNSGMTKRDGKFGPFYACVKYPICRGTSPVPYNKACSNCGENLTIKKIRNKFKLSCMNYPTCRHVEDLPEGEAAKWESPTYIKDRQERVHVKDKTSQKAIFKVKKFD